MALPQRRQQLRVESREEKQVPAVAGRVLIIGRLDVEFLKNFRRLRAALGQDDDVDILLPRQVADKAVQIAPIQIPEQELRHSPSLAEGKLGHELRKD